MILLILSAGKVPEMTKDSHFQGTCTFSVLFELQNIISQLHENIQDHKIKLVGKVQSNAIHDR
jgi:hypothetical protein